MSKNKLSDPISSYIKEIDRLLPYSKENKKPVLNELRQEVQDALKNDNKAPHLVFGSPSEVAKNLSTSHDWKTMPAGWGIRTLAFAIDGILIVGVCLLYLIFGFVRGSWLEAHENLTRNVLRMLSVNSEKLPGAELISIGRPDKEQD